MEKRREWGNSPTGETFTPDAEGKPLQKQSTLNDIYHRIINLLK